MRGLRSFEVEWVCSLSAGIDRLKRLKIVTVILDLSLPDSHGVETFDRVSMSAPGVPILIIVGSEEEENAKKAVQRGRRIIFPKVTWIVIRFLAPFRT